MRQYVPSTMRPQVTQQQLEEAANKLDDISWNLTCKRTQTFQILETLRPQIEKARSQGASWKQIAEQVSNTTGYFITKNMMALHLQKKLSMQKLKNCSKKIQLHWRKRQNQHKCSIIYKENAHERAIFTPQYQQS